MAQFLTPILLQVGDSSANPYSGAKLYIYQSGTTTLLSLFSDEALNTPIANPIVADATGAFAGAFLAESKFKAVLTTSAGSTVWTRDPVYAVGQADSVLASNVSFDGDDIGYSSENVQDAIEEVVSATVAKTGSTMTGRLVLPASAAVGPLNIPHGSTPATLVNGDVWTSTSGLSARINGATATHWSDVNMAAVDQSEAETGTGTTVRAWTAQRVRQSVAIYAQPLPYTGSDAANTSFPIGTILHVFTDTAIDRNASFAPYIEGGNSYSYTESSLASGGAALSGTWRGRGTSGAAEIAAELDRYICLIQRTA